MQLVPFTVRLARGDGLVARFGDVVVYTVRNNDPAAALISAVASAAHNPRAGAMLTEQIGPAAFDDARSVSFGAVVGSAEGTQVLLRGRVSTRVETQQGTHELSGESDPRWVSELLPGALRKAELWGSHSGLTPIPRTDLRAGMVAGGGFVLLGPAQAVPAVPDVDATERISSASGTTATELASRAAPAETAVASATVGVLSTPDGATYVLDRSYVIGRAPLTDDAVRNATASPIVVQYDPYISRVHAYITVDGGGVFVRDAATTAGTFIAAPGDSEWTQIGTAPTQLEPGWNMRIGEWIATYRVSLGQ
ncbi:MULTISPECIES: FHA domain-containing protein [unclassified Mycobacterium]|uniref:FHA domain-containing protein n=1 Tax=unclassified Mycobacterium TaxID=2642494 RepID=UPI0029C78CA1|nr:MULTISPECIES: FHA domain-containing protein [unclassified Mycobacterium]